MAVAHKTGIAGLHSPLNFCMTSSLRHTMDFLLYDWLRPNADQRSRFPTIRVRPSMPCWTPASASRAKYAPFNRTVDRRAAL
jgi:butyryl-CoA dehydrogenase